MTIRCIMTLIAMTCGTCGAETVFAAPRNPPAGPDCIAGPAESVCSITPAKTLTYRLKADFDWNGGVQNGNGGPRSDIDIYVYPASDPTNQLLATLCGKAHIQWDNNDFKYTLMCNISLQGGKSYVIRAHDNNKNANSTRVTLEISW